MNYYYDILVNLQENFYEFYEWEKTDEIMAIKKTPIYRVNHSTLLDFLSYEIIIDDEWTNEVLYKTSIKNKKDKISAFLLTDTKTTIFLKINNSGQIIYRSKLLVEDENNINEIANAMKNSSYNYIKEHHLPITYDLRQTTKEKKYIKAELIDLQNNYNQDKCSYLYFEWFHKLNKDYNDSLKQMVNQLDQENPKVIHHLYHLLYLTINEEII